MLVREQERNIQSVKAVETNRTVENEQDNDYIRKILNKNLEKYEKNLNYLVVRILRLIK